MSRPIARVEVVRGGHGDAVLRVWSKEEHVGDLFFDDEEDADCVADLLMTDTDDPDACVMVKLANHEVGRKTDVWEWPSEP